MKTHFHPENESISEAIKKINGYWMEPSKYEFDAQIDGFNGDWVHLTRNYFYPEGGGQLADNGVLIIEGKSYSVLDAQIKDESVWLRLDKEISKHDFMDISVIAKIDELRRINLSRNHSSQHLISAAFWEELELDTTRAEIGVNESQVELNRSPSIDEVNKTLEVIAQLITDDLPIESTYLNKDQVKSMQYRGNIDAELATYRMITIGDYDKNFCGGTHVSSTSKIEDIVINKIEGKKLRFFSGIKAKQYLQQDSFQLMELGRLLSASRSKISDSVSDLVEYKKKTIREMNKLKSKIVEYQISSATWIELSGNSYKFANIEEVDSGIILKIIGDLETNQIVCTRTPSGIFIIRGTELIIEELMKKLRKNNIKGGIGKTKIVAMGRVLQDDDIDKMIKQILI
jgi:alanyl-tRNA synthetase